MPGHIHADASARALPTERRGARAPSSAAPSTSRLRALAATANGSPLQRAHVNRTGLPQPLKDGIEALSGVALDDVRVHRNSPLPERVAALAFARGSDVHLAPGQEALLPHEVWHVAQQKQGRVKPTGSIGSIPVNDDPALESEADRMGARAERAAAASSPPRQATPAEATGTGTGTGTGTAGAPPMQRWISYKRGGYADRAQLFDALKKIFPAKLHEAIDLRIDENDDVKWAIYGSQVFADVVKLMRDTYGVDPTFAVSGDSSGSTHGPRMPRQVNRQAKPNAAKATKTFNFSSVTLARTTLFVDDTETDFHDRNETEAATHAEDGTLEQLDAYIAKNNIDTSTARLNLTINNFFCTHQTTTKKDKSTHCLGKIIAFHARYAFAHFHVYFKNTYGKPDLMTASIAKLRKAGILVSSFTNVEDKQPYHNKELDPHSDSEDEAEAESEEVEEKPIRTRRAATTKKRKAESSSESEQEGAAEPMRVTRSRKRAKKAIPIEDVADLDAEMEAPRSAKKKITGKRRR